MFWATMSRRVFWALSAPEVMSMPAMRFMRRSGEGKKGLADRAAGDRDLQLLQIARDDVGEVVVLDRVAVHGEELAVALDRVAIRADRPRGRILGEMRPHEVRVLRKIPRRDARLELRRKIGRHVD